MVNSISFVVDSAPGYDDKETHMLCAAVNLLVTDPYKRLPKERRLAIARYIVERLEAQKDPAHD